MTQQQQLEIQRRLLARKDELSNRMVRLDRHVKRASGPLAHDFADQAIERQNDEVVEALWKTTVEELRDVNEALERLARGEYGICERCGDDIPEMRLEALPCTTVCAACARQVIEKASEGRVEA